MEEIKPIETVYKDYRFRSRLEARWAIFFDVLGLTWEYEIEGYDIKGKWYLPDFYIHDYSCFVEIKPLPNSPNVCRDFRDAVGKSIILVGGSPWEYAATWFGWDSCDNGGGVYEDECRFACNLALMVKCERADRTLFVSSTWGTNWRVAESHMYNVGEQPWDWKKCVSFSEFRTREATLAAKQERFESKRRMEELR